MSDDTMQTVAADDNDFLNYKNWSNVTWCLVIVVAVLIAYILYNKFCNKKNEGFTPYMTDQGYPRISPLDDHYLRPDSYVENPYLK